jgi:hypothetical protein
LQTLLLEETEIGCFEDTWGQWVSHDREGDDEDEVWGDEDGDEEQVSAK